MAIWDPADALNHPLDFLGIQNGFVSLSFQQRRVKESPPSAFSSHNSVP